MSKLALCALLYSLFIAGLHAWPVISGILATPLFIALICKWVTRWKDKAVQRALDAEYERRRETQACVESAQKNKQEQLKQLLRSLLDKEFDFFYMFRNTTREAQVDLWMKCSEFGTPVPPLVLPEAHRPFEIELGGIFRGLSYLESQLARVEQADLDFYQKWLEDLELRFSVFVLCNSDETYDVRRALSDIYDLHEKIGESCSVARFSPGYQRFRGMLHIVEIMVDDNAVPTKQMWDYIESLSKQQKKLLSGFLQGKF